MWNVGRKAVLEQTFPTRLHTFTRKRDRITLKQLEMEDGIVHVLAAGDDSHEVQTRTIERHGA